MIVRLVERGDETALQFYYTRNYKHFKPWEPERPADFSTLNYWRDKVEQYLQGQQAGTSAHFIAMKAEREQILAHCNLTQIFYGPFCACYMGFAVSHEQQGKSVMFNTCNVAIDYAFNHLKLHRIMANYMPHNNRSAALLKRLGFVKEGVAKDYLKINGHWENHVLTSLTNPNC